EERAEKDREHDGEAFPTAFWFGCHSITEGWRPAARAEVAPKRRAQATRRGSRRRGGDAGTRRSRQEAQARPARRRDDRRPIARPPGAILTGPRICRAIR